MATTFSGRVALDLLFTEIISNSHKSGSVPSKLSALVDMATGTSNNQINVAYAATVTGVGATTTVYDLLGVLTNTEGTVINFDEVVLVAIKNLGTTATQYLTIGPDATNGFGIVSSNVGFWAAALGSGGGSVVAADGDSWTVMHCKGGVPAAAGSTDELSVVTTGTGNTWTIMILGRDN
jgi:hypothetical protein